MSSSLTTMPPSSSTTTDQPPVATQEQDPDLWQTVADLPQPPTNLIFDDGEPLESNRHRIAMNALIESVEEALSDRSDFFVGGNMFVYFSQEQVKNQDFRGPDVLLALGVDGTKERKGWVIWEEGGRYPDMIIELLSPSTAHKDRGEKKQIYERIFRTADYFVFDPFAPNSLEGWHLDVTHGYQPLQPNDQGWLWCETLGLWLGPWEGVIRREPPTESCTWLRLYDPDRKVIPLSEELAQQERQRAEQERQRAERLAQRLRELGEEPDSL